MFRVIYKSMLATTFILVLLVLGNNVRAQKPPREIRDRRDQESKPEVRSSTTEKRDKWESSQRKESFKDAVDGKVSERKKTDRDPPSRGGRPVEKAEKWSRGDLTKKFNDAANPKPKDDGKKDGGGGNPQPAPKPNLPSPAKRGF